MVDGVDGLKSQLENMTAMKLENLRLNRQVKQLQEREAHLEHCNQQGEKEVRKLEEQLVVREEESGEKRRASCEGRGMRACASALARRCCWSRG